MVCALFSYCLANGVRLSGRQKKRHLLMSPCRLFLLRNYSAAGASAQAVSAVQESAQQAVVSSTSSATSTASVSAQQESASAPFGVPLPQDAKETATTAANKNANFFIFFAFLKLYNNHLLFKTAQRYGLFEYDEQILSVFFA